MINNDEIVTMVGDKEVVKRLALGSNGKVVLTNIKNPEYMQALNLSNARKVVTGTWDKQVNGVRIKLFTVTVCWDDNDSTMISCTDELFQKRLASACIVQLGR